MKSVKLIALLQKEKILKYGVFTLTSGITSHYYCDMKQALGNVKLLESIISSLVPLVPAKATCIAGSGYGGITLASLVAYKKKLPLVLVRDKVKEHGTKKAIDGYVPTKKDYVCVIDDVFTTGSSIADTNDKLKVTNCKLTKPLVVLNRSKSRSVISVLAGKDLLK
jgi:orotate phosphoribosyltransferase